MRKLLFILPILLLCCGVTTEKPERDLADALGDCMKLKWQRDQLIKLVVEREGLRSLTWTTENTVDSLIEVVKSLPTPSIDTLKWIDIHQGLPKVSVLTYIQRCYNQEPGGCHYFQYVTRYDTWRGWDIQHLEKFGEDNRYFSARVMYWMPLPLPPKNK